MDYLISSLGVLQILFQAVAVYLAILIYRHNRLRAGWLAFIFALILMTFRRITASLIEFKLIPNFSGFIAILDRVILPSIISLLLVFGLWTMMKNFENFEIVEKLVTDKIKRLKKR